MTYDLVVVGGGPAGSSLATLVAKTGKRVLLFERDRFPKHKIGESLLPTTVHAICPLLGVSEELAKQNFPIKTGSAFRWGKKQDIWTFEFSGLKVLAAADAGWAYQVERSKFDHILLNNARRHGVDVREDHGATGLVVENDRVVGAKYVDPHGSEQIVRARFVADTSGHTSKIYNYVAERIYSKFFQNVALFGYFLGAKRLPPPFNPGNTLSAAFKEGWFWYIPLSDELTSVGAVIDKQHAALLKGDHHAAFYRLLEGSAVVKDLLGPAKRVTEGQYGIYRIRKDWSYTSSRFWKPGVVILGDAAAFIDPIFSQGVHLATYAALLAARSINTILDVPSADEKQLFNEFERRYRSEFERFYSFLVTFYDMDQEVESYYWSARKFNQTEEKANDAFVSLVSGVSSGEFFTSNATASRRLETYLEREPVRRAHEAIAELWSNRLTPPANEIETTRATVHEGGYVPSADRLHWTRS